MASSPDNLSMALFCDFENVALGVRDAQYDKFDIKPVLERLLLKGSIVVKKAYCDWDRYKGFKSTMHEANFELIEIPHVRQSGKNSADIRLVVDALDLCYTKAHVNTFVIISGDSDFSPLVSKLRENAKTVIGVGVKQSTSDLLIANCDEFIFYDDLVRESQRTADQRAASTAARRKPGDDKRRNKDDLEARRTQAVELASETFDALMAERGDSGKIWASVLKEAIKRRRPDFSESYFGFRAFGNLLEEAQSRGLLSFGRDEKSGAYVYRNSNAAPVDAEHVAHTADTLTFDAAGEDAPSTSTARGRTRREPARREGSAGRERSGRRDSSESRAAADGFERTAAREDADEHETSIPVDEHVGSESAVALETATPRDGSAAREGSESRRRGRGSRSSSRRRDADVPREDSQDLMPTAPFVIPEHAQTSAQPDEAEDSTAFRPDAPAAAPARFTFDPHAPENTAVSSSAAPDGQAENDEAAAPRAKRAARAGRTTRKPRSATPADTPSDNASAAQSDASAAASSLPVVGTPSASASADVPAGPAVSEAEQVDAPKARKTPSRARRPRKTPAAPDAE